MRRKIQKSMIAVLVITLMISYALLTIVIYNNTFRNFKEEVEQEAEYIKTAIDISGEEYLKSMDNVQKKTRVTVINPQGNVTYDSQEDKFTFTNHKERKEIRDALKYGRGSDIRRSDTLKKRAVYYAILLDNGNVLRVARRIDNVVSMLIDVLPLMIGVAVLMIGFAIVLARWQTNRLTRPINEMDLENPLENDVYEELHPLLESLDRQNKEKTR